MQAIDVHTHLHPPRLFAAIRRWFAERSDWELGDQPSEPPAVAGVLRAAGVERFVFCSYAHKPGMASELNGWLAATARQLGGYGLPLASVHPDDPEPLGDLARALDDGCIGLKIHENVQRVVLDDPRLRSTLALLAERGAFVLVHVGPIPWTNDSGGGPERIARVLAAHPRLTIVVAHYGVPDTARYFAMMATHPTLHLDTTMIFAPCSPMHRPVDPHALAAHAERVLYGTDFPNIPYAYGAERAAIESLELSLAARTAILRGNATRLLAQFAGRPSARQ
ncbi:MAG: amidohydrolase family protein [Vulcanimicrobiaceae bacterium]